MNMKFVKGLVIGGLVTTGMVMLWQNDNMFNTNKMMKKGKKDGNNVKGRNYNPVLFFKINYLTLIFLYVIK